MHISQASGPLSPRSGNVPNSSPKAPKTSTFTSRLLFNKCTHCLCPSFLPCVLNPHRFRYNTKCDGRIDQQEFRLLCEDLGYNLNPTQCRLAVKLLDLKGMGGVGFEDFRKWWGMEDRFNRFRRIQVLPCFVSSLRMSHCNCTAY